MKALITVKPKDLQQQVNQILQKHETSAPTTYVCIFDLDGTITYSNTTTLLVDTALSQRPLRLFLYKIILKKILYITYLVQKKLKTNIDVQKRLLTLSLNGFTKKEINHTARIVMLKILKEIKQTDKKYILALMKTLQVKYSVLILSKTLDPLAPHIRSLFNAPTITSKLKYRKGKIAGLERDIEKSRYIQALIRQGYKPLIMVTDSLEELYPQFPVKIYVISE